jgi:hypothetical protein
MATPQPSNGKISRVALSQPAETHAQRIGGPTPGSGLSAVRFYRWVRLDESASRIVEHHPRALWE